MADEKMIVDSITRFARSFAQTDLYDTGYADVFSQCGLDQAKTLSEVRIGLAYVMGYSDACKLAGEYMSSSWKIAHLMGILAGVVLAQIDAGDSSESLESLLETYSRELRECVQV